MAETAKKSAKRGFNIIDIVVVVFILLAAAMFFGSSIFDKVESSEYSTKLEYQVKTTCVRIHTVSTLCEGLDLLDGETGNSIGEIAAVEVRPYSENFTMMDGTVQTVNIPDRYTVYSTIVCDGTVRDDGYFIGSKQISAGTELKLVGEGVETSGTIISIKEIQGE